MERQIEFKDYMVYPPTDRYRFSEYSFAKNNCFSKQTFFLYIVLHMFLCVSMQITFMKKVVKPFYSLVHPVLEAACGKPEHPEDQKASDGLRTRLVIMDQNIKQMETIRSKFRPKDGPPSSHNSEGGDSRSHSRSRLVGD